MIEDIPVHEPVTVTKAMAEATADAPAKDSMFKPTNPDAVSRIAKRVSVERDTSSPSPGG